jgi:hypothetical protein
VDLRCDCEGLRNVRPARKCYRNKRAMMAVTATAMIAICRRRCEAAVWFEPVDRQTQHRRNYADSDAVKADNKQAMLRRLSKPQRRLMPNRRVAGNCDQKEEAGRNRRPQTR